MSIMTEKILKETEEYYFYTGYKNWYPFPNDLKTKLLDIFGKEPFPYEWTEQDIYEGSRKIILEYFKNTSH